MKSEITLRSSHSNERRGCFLTSWKAAEVEMNSTRVCSGVRAPLPQKISPVKPSVNTRPDQIHLYLPSTGSGRGTLNSGQTTTRLLLADLLAVWLFPSSCCFCCCFCREISSTPADVWALGTISSIGSSNFLLGQKF